MTAISKTRARIEKARAFVENQSWLGALLVRVSVGLMFFQSGKRKLGNIEGVTGFFEILGIPAPGFHAVFVGYVEMLGGLAIALGLVTRLAAIPLAITMIVAMATGGAFSEEDVGLMGVLTVSDFTYMAALIWLALSGAGKASLDYLIGFVVGRKQGEAREARVPSQREEATA